MEYDGAGNLGRAYVHGPGTDEPLVKYEAGARQFLHADQQGSIVAINDDGGNLVAINAYDEYGVPKADNVGRFQYTGQTWLPELGLYYYKARMYSSRLGRFLQTDPIGYEDQINLYAYVGDDPVGRTDPTGKQSCRDPVEPCPDRPLPPRDIREALAKDVLKSRGEGERGGQALRDNTTGEITNRTGRAAGRGDIGEFAHNPAPKGKSTILRSHTHHFNRNERGLAASTRERGQNGPSTDDQKAMNGTFGKPVQTIGPDVTTTMFRIDRQDYLVVDFGNRSSLPDLTRQKIIVCETDQCPP